MRMPVLMLLALGLPSHLAGQELTQVEAVQAALASNPRLEAARASRESATAQAQQARWDQLGRLDLGFQWNPSTKTRELSLPTTPPLTLQLGPPFRNQAEVTFTQPLWTWGALSGKTAAARRREESGRQLETREAQLVAFEATRAYLEALQAQEAVAVAEQTVAQGQTFLLTARARVAQGAAPKLDVLKADLSLSEAESRLIAARNQDRSARQALVTVTKDERFRSTPLHPFEAPRQDLPGEVEAIAQATSQRPDLKGSAAQAEALRIGAAAEQAAGLPSLHFRTALSVASDHADGLGQASNRTYAVGLALQWEALSSRRAQLRKADYSARARAQEAQTRTLEDQLIQDVRNQRWRIENARAQIEVAQRALAQAEEQARISRLAYQEGIRTAVERQGDEVALADARYRLIAARLDLGLAWASLRLALGE